ncbi:MAG: OmpA family protein [Candidatus Edwardsbacteria bacterium]|nr:OmpA family protein [Candidatus Edwardsbacteria bacterium]MBU1577082.1 OmpA family protein [Candidatus Edwardsbacteria bacterium]MBU2593142.1 OmpA family protein [Candidatus Edwardsbacteria bacterium]
MKKIILPALILFSFCQVWGQAIKFEFSNIQFRTGRASIDPKTYPALDSLAEFLKNSGAKIEVAGHTDNVGGARVNQRLSRQRAEAVRRRLISRHRIPASRLVAKGYGELFPLVPNLTAEYRAKNRRVEITILSKIRTARLTYIQGNVFTRKQGISSWQSAVLDQVLTIQDEVVTDSLGRAEITFDNGTRIKVLPRSDIVITKQAWDEKEGAGDTELKLLMGRTLSKVAKLRNSKDRFFVATPTAVAGIRGTEFIVEHRPDRTALLSVWENSVSWQGQIAGSIEKEVPSGKGCRCRHGQQPEPLVDLPAPPFPKSPAANDTFFYNPDRTRSITYHWSKPADIKAHLLVWQDVDQNEVLADAVVSTDSFKMVPPKTDKIYWSLTAIDSIGFEGQPWPSRVLNLSRKLDNPRLDILSPKSEQKINSNMTLVTGQTDLKALITINGLAVATAQDGGFAQQVKLTPGINNIMITSTDRAGNITSVAFSVVSSPLKRYELQPFGAGIKLLGGDMDFSAIGFIAGAKAAYNINEKYSLGILGGYSEVGARDVTEIPNEYLTSMTLAGAFVKYTFAPGAAVTPYLTAEAGAIMWKNQYSDAILYESNSPFIAIGPGVRFNLKPGIGLQAEGKAGFMANNDPNSGPMDANNLFLVGSFAICFGF